MSFAPVSADAENPYAGVKYLTKVSKYKGKGMTFKNSMICELVIPMYMYKNNAQTLAQTHDRKYPNFVRDYNMLLCAIFFIANDVGPTAKALLTWGRVPSKQNQTVFVQQRIRIYYKDERGDDLNKRIQKLLRSNDRIERNIITGPVRVDNFSVPQAAAAAGGGADGGANHAAGGPGGAFSNFNNRGGDGGGGGGGAPAPQMRQFVRQSNAIKDEKLQAHQRLTTHVYKRICTVLTGQTSDDDISGMHMDDNFYCPTNIFSVKNSVISAYKAGAEHSYCILSNYFDYDPVTNTPIKYAYPNKGENNWLVQAQEVTPSSYTRVFMPWCEKPKNSLNPEKDEWMKQQADVEIPNWIFDKDLRALARHQTEMKSMEVGGIGGGDEGEEQDGHAGSQIAGAVARRRGKRKLTEKQKAERYENFSNKTTSFANTVTFKSQAILNAKLISGVVKESNGVLERQHVLMTKCKKEMLKDFMDVIWNEEASIPAAIRAIVRYYNEYLKTHKNFNMPRDKATSNLDRFGDIFASLLAQLDTAYEVNTVHMEFIGCWLSGLQVYSGTEFHRHVLSTGPAFSGKSHTYDMLNKLAIHGTVEVYTYSTPKSKTAVTDVFEMKWEVYPEVVPSALGIKDSHGKNKNKQTSNTDAESILKDQLTTGIMRVQVAVPCPDGIRRLQWQEVQCNCCVFMATNAYASSICDPMISRFSVLQYQNKFRADTNGLIGQMGRMKNEVEATLLKCRMMRTQMLVALVFSLIREHVLCEINMSIAHLVISETLTLAGKKHLRHTNNIRDYRRITYMVMPCVVIDALDKVFDLPNDQSPLHGKTWEIDHIFEVEKHLVAKENHITFAMGLEEHAFEDKVTNEILIHLRDNIMQIDPEKNERWSVVAFDLIELPKKIEDVKVKQLQLEQQKQGIEQAVPPPDVDMCEHEIVSSDQLAAILVEQISLAADLVDLEVKLEGAKAVERDALHDYEHGKAFFRYDTATWVLAIPGFDKHYNHWSRINAIAARIHGVIYPKPQLDDIFTSLATLCDSQVKTPKGGTIPAIQFEMPDKIVIAAEVLKSLNATNNVFFECLRNVRSYEGCRTSEYLYGTALPSHPYICRTMKVDALDEDDQPHPPMVVRDLNYHEPATIKLTENALKGVQANLLDTGDLIVPQSSYSHLPYSVIDFPLDDLASFKRNMETLRTRTEIATRPSNYTADFDAHVHEMSSELELESYPLLYKRLDPEFVEREKRDVERNPDAYRLTKMMKEMALDPANNLDEEKVELIIRMTRADEMATEEQKIEEQEEEEDEEEEEEKQAPLPVLPRHVMPRQRESDNEDEEEGQEDEEEGESDEDAENAFLSEEPSRIGRRRDEQEESNEVWDDFCSIFQHGSILNPSNQVDAMPPLEPMEA